MSTWFEADVKTRTVQFPPLISKIHQFNLCRNKEGNWWIQMIFVKWGFDVTAQFKSFFLHLFTVTTIVRTCQNIVCFPIEGDSRPSIRSSYSRKESYSWWWDNHTPWHIWDMMSLYIVCAYIQYNYWLVSKRGTHFFLVPRMPDIISNGFIAVLFIKAANWSLGAYFNPSTS